MPHKIEYFATFLDKSTLAWKRYLKAAPARLWKAITTKTELDQWFMVSEIDLREGGRFSFKDGWQGRISDITTNQHIQFNPDNGAGTAPTGGYQRFEIEAAGNDSILTLSDRMAPGLNAKSLFGANSLHTNQPGGPGTHWASVAAGYHYFVDALEVYLQYDAQRLVQFKQNYPYAAMCSAYADVLEAHF